MKAGVCDDTDRCPLDLCGGHLDGDRHHVVPAGGGASRFDRHPPGRRGIREERDVRIAGDL